MGTKNTSDMSASRILCLKLVLSVFLVTHAICAGMITSVNGPTLPDLRYRYTSTMEEISRATAIKNFGYLFGALLGGIISDRFQEYTIVWLVTAELVMGASTFFIPFGINLLFLGVMSFGQGLGQGFGTPVYVSSTTSLWGKKSAMPMHAIMFGFPLGTVLAPLVAAPFISDKAPNLTCISSNSSAPVHCINTTGTIDALGNSSSEIFQVDEVSDERVHVVYIIIGACTIVTAMVGVILYFVTPKNIFTTTKKAKKSMKEIFSPGSCSGGASTYGAVLVAIFCLFVTGSIGTGRINGLMYSYIRESDLGFDKREAVLFTFCSNLASMGGRALATVSSHCLPIQAVLITEVSGNLLAGLGMAFLGIHDKTMLWVFTLLGNAFNGPMFPSQYAWLDRYIILYSIVVSLTNISMSGSGYLFEWMSGFIYTNYGPSAILYVRLGFSVALAVLYISMQLLASSRGERERTPPKVYVEGETDSMLEATKLQPCADTEINKE